jgi:thiamine biosynthesis lipoprotein
MGTVLELLLVAERPAEAPAIASEVFGHVEALEAELSTWRPESAVSRLNAAAGNGPIRVPPPVARALREATRATRLTRGAFDVTVGPLVELWREAEREGRMPQPAAVAAVRARVGPERIRFTEDGRVALAPGSRVDLGGLAKGFALDRVEAVLREHDVKAALVSFGQSSLLALGRPPDEAGFRVILRGARDVPAGIVTFPERAHFSVSASLGQWREIEGRRLGHVIDPRTGMPLERAALAAVLAPSGALAEALSKALLVLSPDEALSLLGELPGVEGLYVAEDGATRETPGFRQATSFAPFPPAPPTADPRAPGGSGARP